MGCETGIRLEVLGEEKCHKMRNAFKTSSKSKGGQVFKLLALLKMEGKPRRDCIQRTERRRGPEECRRSPQITAVEAQL